LFFANFLTAHVHIFAAMRNTPTVVVVFLLTLAALVARSYFEYGSGSILVLPHGVQEVAAPAPVKAARPAAAAVALPVKTTATSRIANVLLAGAQKAGTTALFYYLKDDGVCTPLPRSDKLYTHKEAHYFDHYYNQGISYYTALYQHCNDKDTSIRLDATPSYMAQAERIHETYSNDGDIKILLILREPVSREISWYHHMLRGTHGPWRALLRKNWYGGKKSFAEYMQDSVLPAIKAGNNYGLYAKYVRQFLERFRSHQIWIANYDHFRTNQTDFLLKMHEFLDLPVRQKRTAPRANSVKVWNPQPISCATKNRLAEHYETANEELYALLEQYDRPFEHFQYQCEDK
jgi:hypothetical protein